MFRHFCREDQQVRQGQTSRPYLIQNGWYLDPGEKAFSLFKEKDFTLSQEKKALIDSAQSAIFFMADFRSTLRKGIFT